jgi:hypothetical protein
MSRRFAINIDNLDTGKTEICEQGIGFFEDLRDVMETVIAKDHKLSDAILTVKRRGTGKDDTSYRIDLDDIKPLSAIELEALKSKSIKLPDFFAPHDPDKILRIVKGEKWEDVFKREEVEDTQDNYPVETGDEPITLA